MAEGGNCGYGQTLTKANVQAFFYLFFPIFRTLQKKPRMYQTQRLSIYQRASNKSFSSSSRAEKNNLIAEMRKLICKPSDRSVCCNIEGYEEEAEAEG
jgi:hypothetical protein